MSIYIEKSLQNSTGFSIWEIKRRTNAKYVDRITWKFCSLMCLQIFGRKPRKELPPIVQERMRAEEERIIKEYGETLTVMAKLQGQDEDDDEDYTIF
jgi:predicted metal-binding protein